MADILSFLISGRLFGWLPVRDFVTMAFFGVSLAVLLHLELTKHPGKFNVWIMGISFWLLGMIFDLIAQEEEALIIIEHLFQLSGSIVIAYAAYGTRKGLRADISGAAGSRRGA